MSEFKQIEHSEISELFSYFYEDNVDISEIPDRLVDFTKNIKGWAKEKQFTLIVDDGIIEIIKPDGVPLCKIATTSQEELVESIVYAGVLINRELKKS